MDHEVGGDAAGSHPPRAVPGMGLAMTGGPALSRADIERALADERIVTLYQPVVRMADRLPLALEVLARLEHPQRGMLGPDLFIAQVEDAGLGAQLTQAVIRRAFADWTATALTRWGLTLALNFPLDVLLLPDALAALDAQRSATGIPAERITIELTESQPLSRLADLAAAVAGLRRAGYGVAIDDVGPSVRDHEALLALGFSALKLDKDLVADRSGDAATERFLCRAIAAGHAASLTVVAEGVADRATWDRMAALGVDQAQGFLISPPIAAAAVPGWQRDWQRDRRPDRDRAWRTARG